jgi:pyridoxal phosphate enzyme (YggS family)
LFEHITENYLRLREEIDEACNASGRNSSEVQLMAVTKTVPAEEINHALSLGISLIGENRVQELLEKLPKLNLAGAQVHLIGHLQTNKVRQVVPGIACIQSLDSLRLAREISARAVKAGIKQKVLAEVNIGGEDSKFGFSPDELSAALEELALLPGISIDGLMTVAPFTQSAAKNLSSFSALRRIFLELQENSAENINMRTLSMGMSSDFREAIAAGSTLIRVGSALFGRRDYR